jgi:anti-sigma-K factor RskA
MHNRIDIDHRHSLAISREIGERLQASLRVEPELPPSIRNWIERFRKLDDQSPSIAPTMERGAENEPRTSERSAETAARTRLGWWRRKH